MFFPISILVLLEYLRESEEKSEFSFAVAGAVNIMRKLTTVCKVIIDSLVKTGCLSTQDFSPN